MNMNTTLIISQRQNQLASRVLCWLLLVLAITGSWIFAANALPKPDIVVAADGSENFKTVQAAVSSISKENHERMVIFVKDGIYREKIRVDAAYITLRGESRKGTRIEYPQLNDDFNKQPDDLGRAVVNVNGDNFVLDNLTVANTAGVIGPHSFAIYGRANRTVTVNCDVLSEGADTVSLWKGDTGKYYHARCNFRGAVDFVCPRGWCYATDCTFYETKNTAAVWHDGKADKDMKFVLRNCKFDGVQGWNLARHHLDAQFYFLECAFSKTMIDRAPFRVIYPLDGSVAKPEDIKKNADLDKNNQWGERAYFYDCHRDGGDYDWMKDNLASATDSPTPEQVTALWTFAGKWDPERTSGPSILSIKPQKNQLTLVFSENVTVKGTPRLVLGEGNRFANYISGSGTNTLVFSKQDEKSDDPVSFDLHGGAIVATEASATARLADLKLPK